MEGWNKTWLGMPNIILVEAHKFQEVVNSPKIDYSKRYFIKHW